ncbi:MAG: hypothetical protein GWN07_16730, partial [Actinobacteria bacterium]|nr:hypothetical protein [Actinomycetota bacterium]NIU67117.1 hypothetical protein [Actinomycetota bacterium]NIV87665.1 hypothetical protein [Actinomycetota bacterium]NIW28900.1 hypothetical protein [Actinomycetota bacterium]NIX21387.1 hypothetical protein [Actinomycetota bacterium]
MPGEPVVPRRETPSRPPEVVPEFRVRLDPGTHLVDARIELDLHRSEPIHLLFRAEWGGYPGLESRLAGLEAWGASGPLDVRMNAGDLGAGHHIVETGEPERVTIAYRMRLRPPDASILYHRASQLDPAGGHLLGGDLLPRVWIGRPRNGAQPARIW